MLIESLTVERFLSFDEPQTLGPMGPVAAVIGRNNVGKSNVFKAVSLLLQWVDRGGVQNAEQMSKLWHGGVPDRGAISLRLVLTEEEWPAGGSVQYPAYQSPYPLSITLVPTPDGGTQARLDAPDGAKNNNFVAAIATRLIILSAQRKTSNESPQASGQPVGVPWDGQGFKNWLNRLDSGRSVTQQARAVAFRRDLHRVAGMESLNPTVHASENNWLDVLLEDGGGFRASLEDCGTGLETVLFVLSALHRGDGSVVLVDDPEAHLHPSAQATFARVVAERARESGGQVIFATHSPAILDAVPPDQVFEVTRSSGVSRVRQMATTEDVFAGLRELGYRPSLLQMADAVLFVEGPNDVAAIRIWWRKLFDEEPEPLVALLVLGGSAMHYLQSVTVKALGRPCFALLDSDRSAKEDPPKPEVVQFVERMGEAVEVHVLERRELENYFTAEAVRRGCNLDQPPAFGPFTDLEHEVPGFSKKRVGAVAAAMKADDIPAEVVDFLRQVREASRA
jgi:predicted ATPase